MGYDFENLGHVVIDLETVAAPECAALLDPVRAPAHYKDPVKIQAYCDEKLNERVANAGLEPDLCEVVAIGWADAEGQMALTRADVRDEADLLGELWNAIGSRPTVGFNTLAFDLPVLMRRSQLLGVPYRTLNLDRYRTSHIDLLERLSFHGVITKRSLAFYCRRFGIPCADTTTGADVPQLVADGNWSAVQAHCAADVTKTLLLAQRLGWFMATGSKLRSMAMEKPA